MIKHCAISSVLRTAIHELYLRYINIEATEIIMQRGNVLVWKFLYCQLE